MTKGAIATLAPVAVQSAKLLFVGSQTTFASRRDGSRGSPGIHAGSLCSHKRREADSSCIRNSRNAGNPGKGRHADSRGKGNVPVTPVKADVPIAAVCAVPTVSAAN